MSKVDFEVWVSASEADALLSILRESGNDADSVGPIHRRSLTPSEATAIVAVSGAIVAVARAFEAYLQRHNKRFGAGTDDGNIFAENYSVEEFERILNASKHIFITDRPKNGDSEKKQIGGLSEPELSKDSGPV